MFKTLEETEETSDRVNIGNKREKVFCLILSSLIHLIEDILWRLANIAAYSMPSIRELDNQLISDHFMFVSTLI